MPDISIIVVSYNTRDLLAECLRSALAATQVLSAEIYVVDNASADGSAAMVKANFPTLNLVCNERNRGFAAANNQALERATGDLVLLLNSDAALVPDCLLQFRSVFETHPSLGIAGAQVLNDDGSIQPSWGDFPTPVTEFMFQSFLYKLWPTRFPYGRRVHALLRSRYHRFGWVDWVAGAGFMLRREVYEAIGGLPEEFRMYGEDLEYCWRARRAGYSIAYCPQAKIYHRMQGASRQNYEVWIENYTSAMLTYYRKHQPHMCFRLAALFVLMGSLLRLVMWRCLGWLPVGRRLESQRRREGYWRAARLALQSGVGTNKGDMVAP